MACSADRAVVILGPTASGKTQLAVQLANRLQGEIISVDSRQVYQGLDIGSGKDLQEYGAIPYHLIDVVSPQQEFSLFDYLKSAQGSLKLVRQNKHLPVLVGGTGLYLDALLRGYRLVNAPENPTLRSTLIGFSQSELVARLQSMRPLHNATDSIDRGRTIRAIEIAEAEKWGSSEVVKIDLQPYVLGIACTATSLQKKITQRLKRRLADGMIEEVSLLQKQGLSWLKLEQLGLEYRYVGWYLQGQLNRNDMQQKLASAIVQFARKQIKWFRRMERRGVCIHWLDGDRLEPALVNEAGQQILAWLSEH